MEMNKENIENSMAKLIYNQPNLKKYGTMKEFTFATGGSQSNGTDFDLSANPDGNDPTLNADIENGLIDDEPQSGTNLNLDRTNDTKDQGSFDTGMD